MKKVDYLISLGESLGSKYAGIKAQNFQSEIKDKIWTAIRNAASWGTVGIDNFLPMIQKDQVDLYFDILRNNGWMNSGVKIYNLEVSNPSLLPKYQKLAQQIQDYLNKHIELFPSKYNGQEIDYDDFILNLSYQGINPQQPIAGN